MPGVWLLISKVYSYLGACLDGFINYICCDDGILEIKYPYYCREEPIMKYKTNPSLVLLGIR